jgi:hypothetical protein
MRVVDTISHPHFKITVFGTDLYFYIEIEAGPMKQAYKFNKSQTENLEQLKMRLDSEFLGKVHDSFNKMYLDFKEALDKKV